MPRQSKLINETTMYSIDKETGRVVTHHLPWLRTSPQLEIYTERGFTFEKPLERIAPTIISNMIMDTALAYDREEKALNKLMCDSPGCGFLAKSEFGLTVHQRRHKKAKV